MSDQPKKSFAVLLANSVLYPHATEQVSLEGISDDIWSATHLLTFYLDPRVIDEILRYENPDHYEPSEYNEEQEIYWGTTYVSEKDEDLKKRILVWHILRTEVQYAIQEIRGHVPWHWT